MARKPAYSIGDVVRIPLDVEGYFGYGRILRRERFGILVEFLGLAATVDPPMDTLRDEDRILTIYCSDLAITRIRTWNVIGHIPVDEPLDTPIFLHRSAVSGKLYLRIHPEAVSSQRETTEEEAKRLRAQPSGLFGDKAAEAAVSAELLRIGKLRSVPPSQTKDGNDSPSNDRAPRATKPGFGKSRHSIGSNLASVRIRLSKEADLQRIRDLEDELVREGVLFDTGYSLDGGFREWHLDLIEGPLTREAILRQLEDRGFDIDYGTSD